MTTILDPALDLSLAPLTNTPLTSTDTTFELADQAGDISNFPNPGALGYYAWVWARVPSYPNVGDANRAGFAERVRVTARDVGAQELTVTRDPGSPIDLNVAGTTYWLVAPMNADYIDKIDERLFDFVGRNLTTTKDVEVPTLFAEQIDLAETTPGVGLLRFLEDTANGTSAVTLQSPAALAGDVAITLPSVLPGSTEYVQLSAAGLLTTTAVTSNVTLDDAYDEGGAGAGRVITADTGPVEATTDGFQSTGLPAVYLLETTDATYNFRLAAQADDLLFQRGDQDTDVSDDTFETLMALDAGTRRAGWNTTNPQDLLHAIQDGSGAARLRLQTGAASQDSSVMFLDQSTPMWETGYDNSAGGYVIGRLSFANPTIFVEDSTGFVGINQLSPTGYLHLENDGTANTVPLIIDVDPGALPVAALQITMDSLGGAGAAIETNVPAASLSRSFRVNHDGNTAVFDIQHTGNSLVVTSTSTGTGGGCNFTNNPSSGSSTFRPMTVVQTGIGAQPGALYAKYGSATASSHNAAVLFEVSGAVATEVLELLSAGTANYIDTDAGAGTPAHLTNAGIWTDASCYSRFKTKVKRINRSGWLKKIAGMPISSWVSKSDRSPKPRRYLTPFQEDLELFGIEPGGVSGREVATVALVGVQELLKRVEALEAA
jgi:hypothetical protein